MSNRRKKRNGSRDRPDSNTLKFGGIWVKIAYDKKGQRRFFIYSQVFKKFNSFGKLSPNPNPTWEEHNSIVCHTEPTFKACMTRIKSFIKLNGPRVLGRVEKPCFVNVKSVKVLVKHMSQE